MLNNLCLWYVATKCPECLGSSEGSTIYCLLQNTFSSSFSDLFCCFSDLISISSSSFFSWRFRIVSLLLRSLSSDILWYSQWSACCLSISFWNLTICSSGFSIQLCVYLGSLFSEASPSQSSSADGLSVSLSLRQWSAMGRRGWVGSIRSMSATLTLWKS